MEVEELQDCKVESKGTAGGRHFLEIHASKRDAFFCQLELKKPPGFPCQSPVASFGITVPSPLDC